MNKMIILLLKRVLNGEFDICLFLNPTKISEVIEISKAKDKMPQKSTYFFQSH